MDFAFQMLLRDYNLETGKKSQPFVEDDIQNLYCVAKHVNPKAVDAHSLFLSGQAKVQQGVFGWKSRGYVSSQKFTYSRIRFSDLRFMP